MRAPTLDNSVKPSDQKTHINSLTFCHQSIDQRPAWYSHDSVHWWIPPDRRGDWFWRRRRSARSQWTSRAPSCGPSAGISPGLPSCLWKEAESALDFKSLISPRILMILRHFENGLYLEIVKAYSCTSIYDIFFYVTLGRYFPLAFTLSVAKGG